MILFYYYYYPYREKNDKLCLPNTQIFKKMYDSYIDAIKYKILHIS